MRRLRRLEHGRAPVRRRRRPRRRRSSSRARTAPSASTSAARLRCSTGSSRAPTSARSRPRTASRPRASSTEPSVNPTQGFGNDPSMEETRSDARAPREGIPRAGDLRGRLRPPLRDDPPLPGTTHRTRRRRRASGEVFRIAFEQRMRFRPVHESALPWLYGLATNLMLKRWRGERATLAPSRGSKPTRRTGTATNWKERRPRHGRGCSRTAPRRSCSAARRRPGRRRPGRLGGAHLRGGRGGARHPAGNGPVEAEPCAADAPRTPPRLRE